MRTEITAQICDQIIDLHESGNTRTMIQRQTGVSQPVIRRVLRNAGYKLLSGNFGRGELPEKTAQLAVELFNNGHTSHEVAEILNVGKRYVLNKIRQHGLSVQPDVSRARFTAVWNSSDWLEEAADSLSLPKSVVLAHGHRLKKQGVQLKHLRSKQSRWK